MHTANTGREMGRGLGQLLIWGLRLLTGPWRGFHQHWEQLLRTTCTSIPSRSSSSGCTLPRAGGRGQRSGLRLGLSLGLGFGLGVFISLDSLSSALCPDMSLAPWSAREGTIRIPACIICMQPSLTPPSSLCCLAQIEGVHLCFLADFLFLSLRKIISWELWLLV